MVGKGVGSVDGISVLGTAVWSAVGEIVDNGVGYWDGALVGFVGDGVGTFVGFGDGLLEGDTVGVVGCRDGMVVGAVGC